MMLGKSPDQNQLNLFHPVLKQIIDPSHGLVLLAGKFPWEELEEEFSVYYSEIGAPAKPVRLMVGLLVLKQISGYSDERLLREWIENPYYQYFCGEVDFSWLKPCSVSELAHFRKRIGEKGLEQIFNTCKELQEKTSLLKRIYHWLKPGKRRSPDERERLNSIIC